MYKLYVNVNKNRYLTHKYKNEENVQKMAIFIKTYVQKVAIIKKICMQKVATTIDLLLSL